MCENIALNDSGALFDAIVAVAKLATIVATAERLFAPMIKSLS